MTDPVRTVFISYRRSESRYLARSIFDYLREHGFDVFLDVETINNGEFDRIILGQIASRQHFIVILTPGSVERCVEPDDWLRREIEFAIETRRNVIPLLVDEFKFASARPFLTGKLEALAGYNSLRLYYEYYVEGLERLRVRFLEQPFKGQIFPVAPQDALEASQRIESLMVRPSPTRDEMAAEKFFVKAYRQFNEEQDLDGAITLYSEAIRLNPTFVEAYVNRGLARARLGDHISALVDYDQAIRLDPGYDLAFNNRGLSRDELSDYEGAIADFNRAIALNPRYAKAFCNRGNARQHVGSLDSAIEDYTRSLELGNPEPAYAFINRACAFYRKHAYARAIVDYRAALRINRHLANAWAGLGDCYYDLKEPVEALLNYQRCLDLPAGEENRTLVYLRVRELRLILGTTV